MRIQRTFAERRKQEPPPTAWSRARPFSYQIDFEKGYIRRRMLEALDLKP